MTLSVLIANSFYCRCYGLLAWASRWPYALNELDTTSTRGLVEIAFGHKCERRASSAILCSSLSNIQCLIPGLHVKGSILDQYRNPRH